ncbi:DinB family protein [Frankia sp. CNm7]|uniref:DinB family protein n=1 Tax=Frankia nepalensis TaxID=1836974 RepID=A0A937RAN0_9ACTN|nr:DinB family protein [Frankia nepalensis]MBL7496156.1 DinB family protein [Frankia nepalensis]MBL7508905.1 DinB family protein [Frankia nepalensis]MBL7516745.1 DinB family protein [Frankia nepalensis]MBL7628683.1 DinB family protein [Frankia nepalensis]
MTAESHSAPAVEAIVPDGKDWTWVLERPCPECGFDASTFPAAEVSGLVLRVASAWLAVLAETPADEARRRPAPDRWSTLEYACHVRDVLRLYDERLQLMLTRDNPLYPNWDQDETAVTDHYGDQDPAQVAADLAAAAAKVAARFATVSGERWRRTGERSDGARFTIDTFARYFAHDPVHHLWDVTGRPGGGVTPIAAS